MEEAIQTQEPVVETQTEQTETQEHVEPGAETTETKPEKTFTQAELDAILEKRLHRERETAKKTAAQEARDAVIAEMGWEWQGKPIKTEAEYRQALKEQEIRKRYEGRVEDEELLIELVESKKFREEFLNQKQQDEAKAKRESDFEAFLKAYPDVKAEDIPTGVWEEVDGGKSLVDAYARHENAILRQKLASLEQAKQIDEQNEANASSSTGSVTGQGDTKPARFTREQVAKMSEAEVNKNWKAIQESMKTWE